MTTRFKDQKQDDEGGEFSLGFKIPKPSSILDKLDKATGDIDLLAKQHTDENEKEAKAGRKPKQRRGGMICMCGSPHCGIGPMLETARTEG